MNDKNGNSIVSSFGSLVKKSRKKNGGKLKQKAGYYSVFSMRDFQQCL